MTPDTVADYAMKMLGVSREDWAIIPCASPCGDDCCRAIANASAMLRSIGEAYGVGSLEWYSLLDMAVGTIDIFIYS
jgi:hypothetical protein